MLSLEYPNKSCLLINKIADFVIHHDKIWLLSFNKRYSNFTVKK
jgi:hypothetical protein